MGVLRNIVTALGGIAFAIFLSSLIFSVGLVEFTKYENLKSAFSEIFSTQFGSAIGAGTSQTTQSQMSEEQLEEAYDRLLEMCRGRDSIQVPVPQVGAPTGGTSGYVSIDCNEVRAAASTQSQGGANRSISDIIGDVTAGAIFDAIYYKRYDCEFIDCVQTGQLGIVFSAQGYEFFKLSQLYLAAGTAMSAAIILISSKTWPSRLKGLGWPMISIGISYFLIEIIENQILAMLPGIGDSGIDMSSLIDKMFGPMMTWFLVTLVAGVSLTAGGYVLAYKEKRKIRQGA